MQNYTNAYGVRNAKQGQKVPGRKMTKSSDGAYVFAANDLTRLNRFLVLGADAPTFYATRRKMVLSNAGHVENMIRKGKGDLVVEAAVDVSHRGIAPNNDPALFALAMVVAFGDPKAKAMALDSLPAVARIGTHLYHFTNYAKDLGVGWGRGYKRAIGNWFALKDLDNLVYQMVKYKSRDGWSARDLLRLSHPKAPSDGYSAVFQWLTHGDLVDGAPERLEAAVRLQQASSSQAAKIIRDHNLPREAVPTELLTEPKVWEALLERMPMMAMIRNLANMTRIGVITEGSDAMRKVVDTLDNEEVLQRARIHPLHVLVAQRTYESGTSGTAGGQFRKVQTWSPVQPVVRALEVAFYKSFKTMEPTNLNIEIDLDISGSMGIHSMPQVGGLTPREASAVMAMAVARTEKYSWTYGFCAKKCRGQHGYWGIRHQDDVLTPIHLGNSNLKAAVDKVSGLPMGYTDLSLPMVRAAEEKRKVDVFVMYTDNETNSFERPHPFIALKEYRQKMGINAKMVVVSMVANEISIADPTDRGMLDVAGFSSDVPAVISNFAKEELV